MTWARDYGFANPLDTEPEQPVRVVRCDSPSNRANHEGRSGIGVRQEGCFAGRWLVTFPDQSDCLALEVDEEGEQA